MSNKEELAKRIDGIGTYDAIKDMDLLDVLDEFLGATKDGFSMRRQIYLSMIGDVTAALAIKGALFPDIDVRMETFNGVWQVNFGAPEKRNFFYEPNSPYGKSNTLSHAIMAALVRATDKEGKEDE